MNIDIFQVNKLCQQTYKIISPLIKNTFKKILTETEIVYIYKNLQLIIDKSGNKKCYEIASKEVKNINDKFITHNYYLKDIPFALFPMLDKYNDQYERTIDKYIYKDIEFMIIRENDTLYFKVKDDVNLNKIIKEIA
ncbi:hypothetical protein Klosneuvirus_2_257 [Klosneuvirus KNV1]|uniref:Uncharacterized protein n=1 Tax=Klosneuvirus KNV1 TaxID=1977640 RepID=A0A1V0SJI7_9VIRU|nr:hypothetical protein Klosneuvirus_2_257 [Klosneuvirus KNV1]